MGSAISGEVLDIARPGKDLINDSDVILYANLILHFCAKLYFTYTVVVAGRSPGLDGHHLVDQYSARYPLGSYLWDFAGEMVASSARCA